MAARICREATFGRRPHPTERHDRERQREVIVRRYGLGDDGAQTHEQIGEWLGVGEERSRQIERDALHRLRSSVGVGIGIGIGTSR
jgi:Sigma-70, region 4